MNWIVVACIFVAGLVVRDVNPAEITAGGFIDETICRTADLAEIHRKFALELYKEVSASEGANKNVVLSPAIVNMGLSMLFMGATNDTKKAMTEALYLKHFYEMNEEKHEIACIFNEYRNIDSNSPLTLELASKLFADSTLTLDETFLTLTGLFGSKMEKVDLHNDTESARNHINNWVYKNTGNRIEELFPSGTLNSLTRLVLASAIYFKGTWKEPFTTLKNGSFDISENETTTVTYMSEKLNTRYIYDSEYDIELAELPYKSLPGDLQVSMILIPSYYTFDYLATEQQWTSGYLHKAINKLMAKEPETVRVKMPKFEIFGDYDMKPHLSAMGFEKIFQPGVANFYGINGQRDLFVDSAVHKAFLKVDEKGSEAAGAFGASVGFLSLPPQVVLHKPFHYILYEKTTETFLFMGRVMNPNL